MAAYIPGYVNSMDVLGFGFTTQSAMFYQSQHAQFDVHNNVTCDGCGANPLRGIRWHCQSCPDHDICNECKKKGVAAGHPFQIMSVTSTNNAHAAATGGPVVPEAGVHWTQCMGCGMNPIKGTLYTCTVCPKYDLCQACNTQRIQNPEAHPHRFDFNYMPVAANPPPTQLGGTGRPADGGMGAGAHTSPYTGYTYGGPPASAVGGADMGGQQQQQQQQQYGYAPPPMPTYGQPPPERSTFGKIYHWLQYDE